MGYWTISLLPVAARNTTGGRQPPFGWQRMSTLDGCSHCPCFLSHHSYRVIAAEITAKATIFAIGSARKSLPAPVLEHKHPCMLIRGFHNHDFYRLKNALLQFTEARHLVRYLINT